MIPKNYIDRVLKRYYKNVNSTVGFKTFSTQSPEPNIYGERIGTKVFNPPIVVQGYLEINPTDLTLKELGWVKEDTEIIFRVPYIILEEVGLADSLGNISINLDCRMVLDGKDYQVKCMNKREPFINNRPTYVWFGGKVITNDRN